MKPPRKFFTVKQRTDADCGAAVAAMAVGDSTIGFASREMRATDRDGHRYYKTREIAKFLAEHGVLMGTHFVIHENPVKADAPVPVEFPPLTEWPCILAAKSERSKDVDHWIFWDGKCVRDPNPEKPDERKIEEFTLIEIYPLIYLDEGEAGRLPMTPWGPTIDKAEERNDD